MPTWMQMLTAVAIATALVLTLAGRFDSAGLWGLLGVLIGSSLTVAADMARDDRERRFQLAIAALEKRLEVHQRAFKLWFDAIRIVNKDEETITAHSVICRDFWSENSLYLTKESRRAFSDLLFHLQARPMLFDERKYAETNSEKKDANQELKLNYDEIMAIGPRIADVFDLGSPNEERIAVY